MTNAALEKKTLRISQKMSGFIKIKTKIIEIKVKNYLFIENFNIKFRMLVMVT